MLASRLDGAFGIHYYFSKWGRGPRYQCAHELQSKDGQVRAKQ